MITTRISEIDLAQWEAEDFAKERQCVQDERALKVIHGKTRYGVALDEFRREAKDSGGEG